jgi:hypothetical protein
MAHQNQHLNLFRHYAASDDNQVLENNLTRALALCLQHDTLFLYAFLAAVVGEDVLKGQLHLTHPDDRLSVDVQQVVRLLPACAQLYAIALTETQLNAASYETLKGWRNDSPITDLVIQYKDVLLLVEVKRTSENCLAQLKGQVEAYREAQAGPDITTVAPAATVRTLSWAQIVRLATNARNLRQLTGQFSPYAADFVQLIRYHFPQWDEVLSFNNIPFISNQGMNEAALYKRLQYIQQQAFGDDLMWLNDRISMPINVTWASEVITRPELQGTVAYIGVNVWPGNTKGQGWSLYGRSLAWASHRSIMIAGTEYPLAIEQYLKFSHFNRWVFEVPVPEPPIGKPNFFHTYTAFEKYSGRWWRESWPELEGMLSHSLPDQWAAHQPDWQERFLNTGRGYTDVALGFKVTVLLPYKHLQQIDTSVDQWQPVASLLTASITALQELINGPATI